MRRSTLFAVIFTALVLIAAGRWPATLADAGAISARQAIVQVLAWRPEPRIATPRTARRAPAARHAGPTGLAPETLAALGAGGGAAIAISLAAAIAWGLRPRRLRRRQPVDALRWMQRSAETAR